MLKINKTFKEHLEEYRKSEFTNYNYKQLQAMKHRGQGWRDRQQKIYNSLERSNVKPRGTKGSPDFYN